MSPQLLDSAEDIVNDVAPDMLDEVAGPGRQTGAGQQPVVAPEALSSER